MLEVRRERSSKEKKGNIQLFPRNYATTNPGIQNLEHQSKSSLQCSNDGEGKIMKSISSVVVLSTVRTKPCENHEVRIACPQNNTLLIPPSSFHEVESPNCSPKFGWAEIWLCFSAASEQIRSDWHFV